MKLKSVVLAMALVIAGLCGNAQEKYNNVHIGLEATPSPGVMASANFNIARNMALGPIVRANFSNYGFLGYSYFESRVGVGVKFDYYFDELMNSFMNWPSSVDLYAGGNAGPFFRFRNYSNYIGDPLYTRVGIFANAVVGGRYHFSDSMSVFAEVIGGAGYASGIRGGLAFSL
ncbi:MAG: hypothetical protein KDC12_01710 [Flavobacteriales bacterium]|nr:hypothetical protein [Flavobacteriales bacterium]